MDKHLALKDIATHAWQMAPSTISKQISNETMKADPPTSGLKKYSGPWGHAQAAHLLRRSSFGPKFEEINAVVSVGLDATLDALLKDSPIPNHPVSIFEDDPVGLGNPWYNADVNPLYEGYRVASFRAWWIAVMILQSTSLTEKMILFWQNHFVIEANVVQDSRYIYKYHSTIRKNALGNFKNLAKAITIEPAMLEYLNGNQNTEKAPNENFARELFELFTIGKGKQIAAGNYSTYTEDDVIAAAKVLTGWRDNRRNINSEFVANRHDRSDKVFSESFGSRVIKNNNDKEYLDLIDMIFEQVSTAKFICRKLYRWFVYYNIDENVEKNIIEPLAQLLIQSNYEIKPVLKALFQSEHFFEQTLIGSMIKDPMSFIIGLFRQYDFEWPQDFVEAYIMWYAFGYDYGRQLEMSITDPPSVAGWSQYYQAPSFYRIWLNSVTLPKRNQFTDVLASPYGLRYMGNVLIINPLIIASKSSDPSDPVQLIDDMTKLMLPIQIVQEQRDYLKNSLIPGLPDYEWTEEWIDFNNDPNNPLKQLSIISKLHALMRAIMSLAEYQLS